MSIKLIIIILLFADLYWIKKFKWTALKVFWCEALLVKLMIFPLFYFSGSGSTYCLHFPSSYCLGMENLFMKFCFRLEQMGSLETDFNDFKQKYSVLEKVNIKVTVQYCNENTRNGNPKSESDQIFGTKKNPIRIHNLNYGFGLLSFTTFLAIKKIFSQ